MPLSAGRRRLSGNGSSGIWPAPLHPLPAAVFAVWRLGLGCWALFVLGGLWPFRLELYAAQGMPRLEGAWWIVFPSPLFVSDAPGVVSALLGVGMACAAGVAVGAGRRGCALGLWFVLCSLAARNPLVFDLSWNYAGWSLLASALVPLGEPRWPWGRVPEGWALPPALHAGAVAVFGLSYTVSGLSKLGRPEWWSGEAVPMLLGSGVARPWAGALLGLPESVLHGMTWGVLAAELLAAPLALSRRGRALGWLAMTGVHLGILATVRLDSLSVGMLVFHLLALDVGALFTPPPASA